MSEQEDETSDFAGVTDEVEKPDEAGAGETKHSAKEPEQAALAAQKIDVAHEIYITWRNTYLRGLAAAAFAQVESGAAALIAAIAAAI